MTTLTSRPGATAGASIIAFPARSDARLVQALAQLDAALGAQRVAMEGFRRSLTVLGAQLGGLEQGLVRYRAKLGTLGMDVAGLHRQARGLEAIADRALPRSSA